MENPLGLVLDSSIHLELRDGRRKWDRPTWRRYANRTFKISFPEIEHRTNCKNKSITLSLYKPQPSSRPFRVNALKKNFASLKYLHSTTLELALESLFEDVIPLQDGALKTEFVYVIFAFNRGNRTIPVSISWNRKWSVGIMAFSDWCASSTMLMVLK